jgi:hypothetical protein
VSPVAKRSITRPVNVALINDASSAALSGLRPSATRRCSTSWRHTPIWSARTAPSRPVTVVSSVRGLVVETDEREVAGGTADPLPPSAVELDLRQLRRALQPLALHLDLPIDGSCQCRGDQLLLGTEVVHEAIDADAECGRHRSQRRVGQTLLGEIVDDAVQQLPLTKRVGSAGHGASR